MCLRRIGLFLFEFLTTERDCKFAVIRIFNNRKWFFDEIEMYSIINLSLKYVLAIYIASLFYFCMLTHLLKKSNGFLMFSGGRERVHWKKMGLWQANYRRGAPCIIDKYFTRFSFPHILLLFQISRKKWEACTISVKLQSAKCNN